MMKTDNLTHATINSEHIKTIKHFCTQQNGRTSAWLGVQTLWL